MAISLYLNLQEIMVFKGHCIHLWTPKTHEDSYGLLKKLKIFITKV